MATHIVASLRIYRPIPGTTPSLFVQTVVYTGSLSNRNCPPEALSEHSFPQWGRTSTNGETSFVSRTSPGSAATLWEVLSSFPEPES